MGEENPEYIPSALAVAHPEFDPKRHEDWPFISTPHLLPALSSTAAQLRADIKKKYTKYGKTHVDNWTMEEVFRFTDNYNRLREQHRQMEHHRINASRLVIPSVHEIYLGPLLASSAPAARAYCLGVLKEHVPDVTSFDDFHTYSFSIQSSVFDTLGFFADLDDIYVACKWLKTRPWKITRRKLEICYIISDLIRQLQEQILSKYVSVAVSLSPDTV